MKKFTILAFIISCCICSIHAQDNSNNNTGNNSKLGGLKLGKKDAIVMNFYTDIWQKNDSSMSIRNYSPGFDIYLMKDITFGKSKFSFGYGLGISVHNMHSDAVPKNEMKWDSATSQNVFTGKTIFSRIPDYVNNNEIKYDNNKLTLTYIEIPLELRYKKENKRGKMFKFSVGGKAGYLLSSYTKYKGTKYEGSSSDPDVGVAKIKIKNYNISNLQSLSYGVTMRVGYGLCNIFGYYSLSKIFKKDKGPEMYPISVGISITPF